MGTDGPTFSVIAVYNDPEILSKWLEQSIESQNYDSAEYVFIDNTDDQYDCAAAALNAGARRASGEYYVFAHQDVRLLTESWFADAERYLRDIPDCGIAGVSGRADGIRPRNIIYHGKPVHEFDAQLSAQLPDPEKKPVLSNDDLPQFDVPPTDPPPEEMVSPVGQEINSPTSVETLDELLTIVPASVFAEERFDPNICDGWHLYAVELCLRIKYRTDREVYALPLPVWHYSKGMPLDTAFYDTLLDIVREYEDAPVDYVYATTGRWPMRPWLIAIECRCAPYPLIHRLGLLRKGIRHPFKATSYVYSTVKRKIRNPETRSPMEH